MNIVSAIQFIYPGIDFLNDVIVQDDGQGAYIKTWNYHLPQPTQAELDAAILPAAKKLKTTELKSACKAQIESGFVSDALGSPHTYDSSLPQDQINLTGAKLVGIDMDFTCTDSNGIKWYKPHTAAQLSQVYTDGMIHIQSAKIHLYGKLTLLNEATDIQTVAGISW